MEVLGEIKSGVGKRISKVRESAGLSARSFGERVGVGQRYINMLERDERQPSQALTIAISAKYGISEDWLRSGRGRFRNGRQFPVGR